MHESGCFKINQWLKAENISQENVIYTSVLDFLRYGGKISIVSLKDFVVLTVSTGYVLECPIIGYQT